MFENLICDNSCNEQIDKKNTLKINQSLPKSLFESMMSFLFLQVGFFVDFPQILRQLVGSLSH